MFRKCVAGAVIVVLGAVGCGGPAQGSGGGPHDQLPNAF